MTSIIDALAMPDDVVEDVLAEAHRAVLLFGETSMAGAARSDLAKLPTLIEEVGEVAEALMLAWVVEQDRPDIVQSYDERRKHADSVREELVQVAAAAMNMVAAIDRRLAKRAPCQVMVRRANTFTGQPPTKACAAPPGPNTLGTLHCPDCRTNVHADPAPGCTEGVHHAYVSPLGGDTYAIQVGG